MAGEERPDCFKCAHFRVTWEARYPRSCAFFGIKTPLLPSEAVFQSCGEECQAFSPKKPPDAPEQEGHWEA